jgi:hypothetical protein
MNWNTVVKGMLTLGLVASASGAIAAGSDSKVIIKNQSNWAIHEMYFSPTSEREWGPDQLGEHTINTGDTFTLNGVPCAAYDVKVVDEDGDECVLEDVGLCADKDEWTVTDDDLLGCQAATADE